jgi:hypothetical protein
LVKCVHQNIHMEGEREDLLRYIYENNLPIDGKLVDSINISIKFLYDHVVRTRA